MRIPGYLAAVLLASVDIVLSSQTDENERLTEFSVETRAETELADPEVADRAI
jgi:hypothetical protein